MPSFDETKATMDALYEGGHQYSPHAANAFATPRTPSGLERAFTTDIVRTSLVATVVSYSVLGARIALG